ncbi:hypothetical protein BH09VER1_BH09VER1_21540 [soil metagenome]
MKIAAGVTTCNEENTIGPLMDRILAVPTVTSLTIVSSACRDRTEQIVKRFAERDQRVQLISEPVRRGKSAAVNTFLADRPESDLTLISSGDVLPAEGAIADIIRTFENPTVGMAGGRPIPENELTTLSGRIAHLTWNLHHRMALISPKLGELTVFRSHLVTAIPEKSTVDEASLEFIIHSTGHSLAYAPNALIHNRGPDTLKELLSRRRSNAYGHQLLARQNGYRVSTTNNSRAAKLLIEELVRQPSYLDAAITLVGVEVLARLLALKDSLTRRDNLAVWDIAASTKKLNISSSER